MTPPQLEAAHDLARRAAVEAGGLLRRASLDLGSLLVEENAPGDASSRTSRVPISVVESPVCTRMS